MTVLRTQNWLVFYEIYFILNRNTVPELKNQSSTKAYARVTENSLIFVIPQWLPSMLLDNVCLIMSTVSQYYAKF